MAKKTKKKTSDVIIDQPMIDQSVRDDEVTKVLASIQKEFGKDSIMRMGDTPDAVPSTPSGCLSLDFALGGGFPHGRVVEIFGTEGAGKCLTPDTYIPGPHGLLTLTEVFRNHGLSPFAVTRTTPLETELINRWGSLESTTAFTHNYKRPVFTIETRTGSKITSTANHPHLVMSKNGNWVWRHTGKIHPGDYLIRLRVPKAFGPEAIPNRTAYALGVLVADAHFQKNMIGVTNDDPDIKNVILEDIVNIFGIEPKIYPNNDHGSINYRFNSKESVASFYDKWKIGPGVAKDKCIPLPIRRSNKQTQKAFLQGYFDCECHIDPEKGIEVASASETLLRQVQLMLQSFGITAFLDPKVVKNYPDNEYWRLWLRGKDARKYVEEIGTKSNIRKLLLDVIVNETAQTNTNWDTIPHLGLLLQDLYEASETTREHGRVLMDYKGSNPRALLTYDRLNRILALPWNDCAPLNRLRQIAEMGYIYDPVVSVTANGEKPTFDFAMANTASFIANGFVTHNTTVALHAVAQVQKAGERAVFIDAEHAIHPAWVETLGVNIDELVISQPNSGEEGLNICSKLVESGVFRMVVVDSVAALVPKAELDGDIGDTHVALLARMMSQTLRILAAKAHKTNTTVMFINQLRERIGVFFGDPSTTPGGRALKFYSSVRVDVRRIGAIKDGDLVVGNRTRAKVVKNKVAPPFRQAEFDIIYTEGISWAGDLIDLGVKYGIVDKAGAWFSYGDIRLGQGREKAKELIRNNTDLATEIEQKIKDAYLTANPTVKRQGAKRVDERMEETKETLEEAAD